MFTSSNFHVDAYSTGISYGIINDPQKYSVARFYAASKLALIYHAQKSSEKFKGERNVLVNIIHPGIVRI